MRVTRIAVKTRDDEKCNPVELAVTGVPVRNHVIFMTYSVSDHLRQPCELI